MREFTIGDWYRLIRYDTPDVLVVAQCVSYKGDGVARKYKFSNSYEVNAERRRSSWDVFELTELEKALI